MLVEDKLTLALRLVLECLYSLEANYKLVKFEKQDNVIKATVTSERDGVQVEIIGAELEKGKRCMVSMFQSDNDRPLGQAIFLYADDLGMESELALPMDYESYTASMNSDDLIHVLRRIADKLGLEVRAELKQVETEQMMNKGPQAPSLRREEPLGKYSPQSATTRRPADMPRFEDEYQIHDEPGFRPSNLREPSPGYGDRDLYPTGQKYPNLADPTTQMPPMRPGHGQGGMIFDPSQEQARKQEEEQGKLRGPGWIPGAKYDDPYGRPGFGGNSGPGSSGFGFGGGGFI